MNKRNSSLELLRIICMMLIVIHHYSVHGGYETFNSDTISSGQIFIQCCAMFGKLSCSIFAMITGFFMVEKKSNNYRRIINLSFKMHIYSWTILVLVCIFNLVEVSLGNVVKLCFPLLWGGWYAISYIILCLIAPILNSFLVGLSKKNYQKLLIIIILVWSIIPTISMQAYNYGDVDFFLVMYIIGGFIKLHVKDKVYYSNKWNLVIALGTAVLLVLSVVCIDYVGILFESNKIIAKATYFKDYNSILAVICAVATFVFFVNIEFSSKIINRVATTTLGIYLIHDNKVLRVYIWEHIYPNIEYLNNPYLHMLIKVVCVFTICMFIDLIYNATIGKFVARVVEKKVT